MTEPKKRPSARRIHGTPAEEWASVERIAAGLHARTEQLLAYTAPQRRPGEPLPPEVAEARKERRRENARRQDARRRRKRRLEYNRAYYRANRERICARQRERDRASAQRRKEAEILSSVCPCGNRYLRVANETICPTCSIRKAKPQRKTEAA